MTSISQCHNAVTARRRFPHDDAPSRLPRIRRPLAPISTLEPRTRLDDRVHRRRWVTLAVLCVSLLVIVDRQHDRQRGAAHAGARPRHQRQRPPVGRRRLHARVRRPAPHRRQPRRPLRSQGRADHRPRHLRRSRRRPRRSPDSVDAAHRRSRGDGHRRRADHAGDAVDPHQRLHRRARAARSPSACGRASPASRSRSARSIGGFLLEHFWWGSVFIVNVPIVIAAIVAGAFLVPTSRNPIAARIDCVGALLSIVGLGSLVWSHHRGAEQRLDRAARSWPASRSPSSRSCSFVWWERRIAEPMLDVRFFTNPRFTAASVTVTLVFFALFGFIFLATQYLQFVLGYSRVRGGRAHAAVRGRDDGHGAAVVEGWWSGSAPSASSSPGCCCSRRASSVASTSTVDSGYDRVVIAMVLMGGGMGLVGRAGDGVDHGLAARCTRRASARPSTTRRVRSVARSASRSSGACCRRSTPLDLNDALPADVPAPVRDAADQSVGAALAVSGRLGGCGAPLADAAREAFVYAMSRASLVTAAVALVGALLAWRFLPARAAEARELDGPETEPELERRRPRGSRPSSRRSTPRRADSALLALRLLASSSSSSSSSSPSAFLLFFFFFFFVFESEWGGRWRRARRRVRSRRARACAEDPWARSTAPRRARRPSSCPAPPGAPSVHGRRARSARNASTARDGGRVIAQRLLPRAEAVVHDTVGSESLTVARRVEPEREVLRAGRRRRGPRTARRPSPRARRARATTDRCGACTRPARGRGRGRA